MKTKPVLEADWQRMTELERNNYIASKRTWTNINYHFQWKIIVTIFLIFIIECLAFCVYNFHHKSYSYSHPLFKFSLAMAIIWCVIMFILWVLDIQAPMREDVVLDSLEYE